MDGPIVTTKQGKLQGAIVKSILDGSPYISFKGIPFAAPPIGKLRFKDPEPPSSWLGVRDATQNAGTISAQTDDLPPYEVVGGEDCLYLSVYTPSLTGVKPVIVYIHGGAFISESGLDNNLRPDYLITKDVVLVFVNYRLGILGFLNLNHEVASGNQGMKDQVAALRWTKENIMHFGGDPNNITIFGSSTGAGCVHLLCLSPMAKGLFHKAIIQGGSAKCSWCIDQSRIETCFKVASMLGINSRDPQTVVEFLRAVPLRQLVKTQRELLRPEEKTFPYSSKVLPFGPTIDDKAKEPFLPMSVEELCTNEVDIPLMLGSCTHEFILFMKDSSEETCKKLNNILPQIVAEHLLIKDSEQLTRLTEWIKAKYFDNKSIVRESIESIIRLMSDLFKHYIEEVAEYRSRKKCAPTYVFRFAYIGDEETITQKMTENPAVRGVSHSDELTYLLYSPRVKINNPAPPAIGTKDRAVLERCTRMWTNFAKTGNPTPTTDEYITTIWKPVTESELNYLEIGEELQNRKIHESDKLM